MAMLCLCSCGDDDESGTGSALSGLIGTWYGERSNANQSITVIFRKDKTGEFTYESNVYYRVAEFTYSVSGDQIVCKGIIAGEDGVVNNWNQTFEWCGSYLAPIGAYSDIYLYKNGQIPDDDYSNYNNSNQNGSGSSNDNNNNSNSQSGTIQGHDYVNLGLPSGTLWATCNVGANKPEEYGSYYAWGEINEKSIYDWSTYKWMKKGYSSWKQITKYTVDDGAYGSYWYNAYDVFIGDGKDELLPVDDAATTNWGNRWQMPSETQFKELINTNYTTTEWTTLNGKNGCKITSKKNGKSIFLPAAGSYEPICYYVGEDGEYWSRTLNNDATQDAFAFYFDNGFGQYKIDWCWAGRDSGFSVRPVVKQ